MTEHVQTEAQRLLTSAVFKTLNEADNSTQLVRELLLLFKDAAQVDAAGIRLRVGDDFPYYEHNGFADDFIRKENSLCARDAHGNLLCNARGRPIIECTCGLVLEGRTEPALPWFTRMAAHY